MTSSRATSVEIADLVPRQPYRLRLGTAEGTLDFDADPIPLLGGGGDVAARLIRTVRTRDIQTLDGWIVYPRGAKRRCSMATSAVIWCMARPEPSPDEDAAPSEEA